MTDVAATPTTEQCPHRKSVRAGGTWRGSMTTEITVRDFAFRSDEPEAIGGTNSAPTPMELVAGAVNGCITVVIETIAREQGIRLQQIETTSKAHLDTRGFHGTAEVSPHFQDFDLHVKVASSATEAQHGTLARDAEKRCPAINLVRDAGVNLDVRWEFVTAT